MEVVDKKGNKLTPCSKEDYLEQDDPVRGQNYVCLSFISPEDVLDNKEVFFFNKFLDKFSLTMNDFFNGMKEKYPEEETYLNSLKDNFAFLFSNKDLQEEFRAFKNIHSDNMEKEFAEMNDFRTSMRGLKIRGVYETIKEAKNRSEKLKKVDKTHNIFIAEVGCWCPWSPSPDSIDEQEYAEQHLNTLMKKYKENQKMKDEFYAKRKEMMIEKAKEEGLEAAKERGEESSVMFEEGKEFFEKADTWTMKKMKEEEESIKQLEEQVDQLNKE